MDEFWSFAGVIGLWLGVSCGLWWLHRRSVHSKQRRQMRQAVRAAAYLCDAQKVFDAIRRPTLAATNAALTAETHALLKRLQDNSGYFDKVNVLRVDMLAAFGIEDYPPLAEILHIRRDLWAASEIVLVEDLSSFGESFAEPGAYERFRAEAAALLFGANGGDEDVIDLRLSLARGEAERLAPELKEAIRLARERDRLPTVGEIIAYPVGLITAVPGKLAISGTFLREFYGYAAEIAGAIRRSEAMERGVSGLRRAREELPQRLVTGFERASGAARQSGTDLRQHYDFLVAAHDFQAKYEQRLRRAPQITERGRQFIARLELAEHSERLRLTSANFLIWLTRQLATGLAYFIAGLQQLHALVSETPPGILAAALVAPTPVRGRDLPAFRSYRMALGASGLGETRPVLASVTGSVVATTRNPAGKPSIFGSTTKRAAQPGAVAAAKTPKSVATAKSAKGKRANGIVAASRPATRHNPDEPERSLIPAAAAKPTPALPAKSKPGAVKAGAQVQPPATPEKLAATAVSDEASKPVSAAKSGKTSPAAALPAAKQADPKRGKADQPVAKPATSWPAELNPAAERSKPTAVAAVTRNGTEALAAKSEGVAPEAGPSSHSDAPGNGRRKLFSRQSSRGAEIDTPHPTGAEPLAPRAAAYLPAKRRSFLDRLLGRRPPEPTIGDLLAAAWEREHAAEPGNDVAAPTAPETAPTLLAKLSQLPEEDLPEAIEDEDGGQDDPVEEDDAEDDIDDFDDDHPSLTASVLEVQAKLAPRPAQIRSFPWLRG